MFLSLPALAALWACHTLAKPLPAAQITDAVRPRQLISSDALSLAAEKKTYTTGGHTFIVVPQPSNSVYIQEETTSITMADDSQTMFNHRHISIDSTGSLIWLSKTLDTSVLGSGLISADATRSHSKTGPSSTTSGLSVSATSQHNSASITLAGTDCRVYTEPRTTQTASYYPSGATTLAYHTFTYPEQLACTCSNGDTAGVFTEINRLGRTKVVCAVSPTTRAPFTTIVPTGTPGDPNNPDWADVPCTFGALTDAQANPKDQWDDAGAAAAWADFKYNVSGQSGVDYSNLLSNFFNAREDPDCADITSKNCGETVQCGQYNSPNPDVNSPAGEILFNSMMGVNAVYSIAYDSVRLGSQLVLGYVGTLVQDLSPINADILQQQQLKIGLDVVQGIFFFFLAPVLHTGFAKLPFYKDNAKGFAITVDSTYGALGATMAAVKDSITSLSALPVQNDISTLLTNMTIGWLTVINDANVASFSNIDLLGNLLADGKFFQPIDTNSLDASLAMSKAFIAALAPSIWVTGSNPAYPAILTSAGLTTTGGCSGFDPTTAFPNGKFVPANATAEGDFALVQFDSTALSSGAVCVNDSAYWLLGGKFAGDQRPPYHASSETILSFDTLPGIADFSQYQDLNLSYTDIAMNAINSWQHNGYTNGWGPPDITDPEFLQAVAPQDLTNSGTANLAASWGLIHIPVCSWEEMASTLYSSGSDTTSNPNYPCPAM